MTRLSAPIPEDTALSVGVTIMALYTTTAGKESVWLQGVTTAQREGPSEPEGEIPIEYEVKFGDRELRWFSAWDLKRKTASTPTIGTMVNLTPSSPPHAIARSKKNPRPPNDPGPSAEDNNTPKKKTKNKGSKQHQHLVVTNS